MRRRVLLVFAGCAAVLCGIGLLSIRRPTQLPWAEKCEPLAESARAHADDCATDDDCVVTTLVDGACCQTNCGPGEAHNRAFVEALRVRVAGYDQHQRCPDVMCLMETTEVVPRCEQKHCLGRQVPIFDWASARATACDHSLGASSRIVFRDRHEIELDATWSSDASAVAFTLRSTDHSLGAPIQSRALVSLGAWLAHHAPAAALGAAGSADDAPACSAYLSELASRLHVDPKPPLKPCSCPAGDPLCSCL